MKPNENVFILGNPPYVGASNKSPEQKADMELIFDGTDRAGVLDYVSAWYKIASDFVLDFDAKCAFVATNSISQGEQVAVLWGPLLKKGIEITFAYRTFRWSNDAKGNAAVHCVIIGIAKHKGPFKKKLFDSDGKMQLVENINPYLVSAPNIFISSRTRPICSVPIMTKGSQPTDDSNLLLEVSEKKDLIIVEPQSEKFIRRFIGSKEFINGIDRYCLWLVNASPNDLLEMPHVMERVRRVREARLASKKAQTRSRASTPAHFTEIRQPLSTYIAVPEVSSENRQYVPMGFMQPDVIASNKIQVIPGAALYEFGILNSNMHMAWMRTVCGRLKSDYDYSSTLVYNNYPWPVPTDHQRHAIEAAAQGILDARGRFPTSSLAALYDPLTMPPELVKAHSKLDAEVEKAYGRRFNSDVERVAFLFEKYAEIAAQGD